MREEPRIQIPLAFFLTQRSVAIRIWDLPLRFGLIFQTIDLVIDLTSNSTMSWFLLLEI